MTQKLIVIGGGFTGITVANEVSKTMGPNVEVTVVEKLPDNLCGGVAYGAADDHHETNISARRMGFSDMQDGRKSLVELGRVTRRQEMKEKLQRDFDNARNGIDSKRYTTEFGTAKDIVEFPTHAEVTMDDGTVLKADRVVVATGNHEILQIPVIKQEQLDDPSFSKRYVRNQWEKDQKKKIKAIPSDEPVVIIGTALSAYDAVRSLLRQGHTGSITMISRNGNEHFKYPEDHEWEMPDTSDDPNFIKLMREDADTMTWLREMISEFRELTGVQINSKEGDYSKPWSISRLWNRKPDFLPEAVLTAWEKYIPEIVEHVGIKNYGSFIRRYGSAINTLRVGAGHNIFEEMNAAKKSGQLKVVKGDIEAVDQSHCGQKLHVTYTPKSKEETEVLDCHTLVSSLGANQNYARTQDPLWRNILDHGYTTPHPVGVGVSVKSLSEGESFFGQDGKLENASRIYAAGTPVAGEAMVKLGIFGPPAFSVPGISRTLKGIIRAVRTDLTFDGVKNYDLKFDGVKHKKLYKDPLFERHPFKLSDAFNEADSPRGFGDDYGYEQLLEDKPTFDFDKLNEPLNLDEAGEALKRLLKTLEDRSETNDNGSGVETLEHSSGGNDFPTKRYG